MTQPDSNYRTTKNLTARADFVTRYANRNLYAWVADHIAPLAGAHLDVGCGTGWFWASTRARWQLDTLTLLDTSEAMLASAKARLAEDYQTRCVTGDVAHMPFDDGAFPSVSAMQMLYHTQNPRAALTEIARVLAPGGRVFMTSIADDDLAALNALSREVFGSAGADLITPVFGTRAARAALGDVMAGFDHHTFEDTYQIDNAEAVVNYLRSFPPGIDASEDQIAALRDAVSAALAKAGGVLAVPRKMDLYVWRKEPLA